MTAPLPDVADLLALLLRATLLMAAAWAAAAALRKAGASAAARHMAWLFGIAGLLALPLLWALVPDLRLPILPAETAASAVPPAAAPLPPEAPAPWSLLLPILYASGTAILLLRLAVGRQVLRRLWNDAGAVSDPAWEKLLSQLAIGMPQSRRVELRLSRAPTVPMTWGTVAPRILLPAEASHWPPERRRLVLLHELAHVARRDSLSRSLASLACALYWFHPGAWLAARQMRAEQEHAADDHVLMAGGSPQAYALSLLHLARGPEARPRFDQAAAMAGMYQLERRLVSITGTARRNRPGAVFLSSSAFLACLTTVLVAAGVPVSASPTPLPARPPAQAPLLDRIVDSRPAESSSMASAEIAPNDPGESIEPAADESEIASRSRPDRPASTAAAESGPADGDGVSEPAPQAAAVQPLRDLGWELPRRDSLIQIESGADEYRPARLTLPQPVDRASSDRSGPPRWARNVPRLVRGRPPTGSPVSAQGPLELSWSIEVVGK